MNIIDLLIIAGAVVVVVLIVLLQRSQVPFIAYKNKPVYSDHRERPVKALFSSTYGLAGKPDFILHTKDGLLPLEIKSSLKPNKPYFSDVMQLISYCLLMEQRGDKPRYGFLQYSGGRAFSVSYTEGLRSHLLRVMEEMRACVGEPPGRCRRCNGLGRGEGRVLQSTKFSTRSRTGGEGDAVLNVIGFTSPPVPGENFGTPKAPTRAPEGRASHRFLTGGGRRLFEE